MNISLIYNKIGDYMKKGFTLIELLAVFVILGIVVTISVPIIGSVINSSRKAAYEEQVKTIEHATRTFMSKNPEKLPSVDKTYYVSVANLKGEGLIQSKDIKNPIYQAGSSEDNKKEEYFNGCVKVTNNDNKFKYKYSASDCNNEDEEEASGN